MSQRPSGVHRIPKRIFVRFLSKIVGFWSDFGQILGKIGQIVGQILESFSQDSNNIYIEF